jgi:hypothetical protein
MKRFDILFETNRFNVSEVKRHFINPCCFGEDLADWLRQKLRERDVSAETPGQEDWGWYVFAQRDSQRYFLGIAGYARAGAIGKNDGEWRIMVEKKVSAWEKVRGANKLTEDDPILVILDSILRERADIHNFRREIASR